MEVFIGLLLWGVFAVLAALDPHSAQDSLLIFIAVFAGILFVGTIHRRDT